MGVVQTKNAVLELLHLDPDGIRERLACSGRSTYEETYPPGFFAAQPDPAAVLLPLFRAQEGWRLLFIRRAENAADRHGGQVAFPGGRVESGDRDPEAAALREAHEEIGLEPDQVRILGSLATYRTVSNFLVTPVVGLIPWPVPLRPDNTEVSRVFSIPLAWLWKRQNHRISMRSLEPEGPAFPVIYFQPYDGELLWGVSARITLGLLDALREPSFGYA